MRVEKFDLIFSLGGSCMASKQLRKKGLQFLSFPFYWLFQVDNSHIQSLITIFQEDFINFLGSNSLVKLVGNKRGTFDLENQYKDINNGFRFIHGFKDSKTKKIFCFLDCKYKRATSC